MRFSEVPQNEKELGLNVIKRFMMRQVKYYSLFDLQMGIESNYKKVNLYARRNRAPWIENLDEGTITTHSETGLIYRDYKGVKRILLLEEIHKYCDGMLRIIEEHLEESALKLKNSENPDDLI
ncbi:unnamed protein product [Cuscuta europaea]|uniref:Uncharacterized protein n=1 Tax=Cuscuta europaea TaxID=41803 RepID=A0A9P0ZVD0_CUSEU|nr:unnamed protein product [Cuscuta europaea]